MCGGTFYGSVKDSAAAGQSPRVRGNQLLGCRWRQVVRSIPACAGEPGSSISSSGVAAVYPRVCGGTKASLAAVPAGLGLSPRVRGNPIVVVQGLVDVRSIPACAGEPSQDVSRRGDAEVYPRVCGGTYVRRVSARFVQGLSPRVRGNQLVSVGAAEIRRSIPACAGEPQRLSASGQRLWVYPRVCGGTGIS